MPFVPTTEAERAAMLERVGARSTDELFAVIPSAVRFPPLDLPAGEPELSVARRLRALAGANRPAADMAWRAPTITMCPPRSARSSHAASF
jgi:glycine dehydrogenase subunit 1